MSTATDTSPRVLRRPSTFQMTALVLLRVAVGWHFLYEGIAKLSNPDWTSKSYLDMSRWVLVPFFEWVTSNPTALAVVDFLNVWGLIAIGVALMLGLFTRLFAGLGVVLLLLYYLAYPPFGGLDFATPSEGHYLIVNKTLVELFALAAVLICPTGTFMGLDRLIYKLRQRKRQNLRPRAKPDGGEAVAPEPPVFRARRDVLASIATVPFLGGFVIAMMKYRGWFSHEEQQLKKKKPDAISGATIKTFDFSDLSDLEGQIPQSSIGDMGLSRLILGGNLVGGWAHARDLIYVSKLIKAYHHDEKVFQTFMLAEKCGVNTFLTNPKLCRVINEYWRRGLGKIQFISDCGGKNLIDSIKISIDGGASACYIQGATGDRLVREGKFDLIADALELMRKNKLPAGIGGHSIETIKACVKQGFEPDFWMKTLHHHNYWSAGPKKRKDSVWCEKPDETIAFMEDLPQPWIAFKTLAAGAIHPKDGFKYAFENGADFVCVGMYDFQIVEDVNIAMNVLGSDLKRKRPWVDEPGKTQPA